MMNNEIQTLLQSKQKRKFERGWVLLFQDIKGGPFEDTSPLFAFGGT
jgi:hypothetical protein